MLFIVRLDRSVFTAINSIAGKSNILDWIARLGADDHIVPIVMSLLLILIILKAKDEGQREDAFACFLCALIAAAISMAIGFILNMLFFRPRPFMVMPVHLIFYRVTDSGFPSKPAILVFALAFSVLFFNRRMGYVMLALASYVCLARIVVGIHYPLDIIGGILLALACACFARVIYPAYRPLTRRLAHMEDRLMNSLSARPIRLRRSD
jgi:undecaprenyl-diphosphatase